MASFVFVRPVEKRDSALAWKKTAYRSRTAWLKASRAVEGRYYPFAPSKAVSIPCLKLPNGRCVQAEVHTEASIEEDRVEEKARKKFEDRLVDKRGTPQSRKKAFEVYLVERSVSRKSPSSKRRSGTKRT